MSTVSNKADVVIKLVLVFFVSLLSFAIGTYVGRKYSDNQHRMSQLEPGDHGTESSATSHGEATESSDHGTASKTESSAESHEKSSESHHEANASKSNDHGTERTVASETKKSEHGSDAMTDEEIAKLAEEFVNDDKPAATSAHGAKVNNKEEPQGHSKSESAEHRSKQVELKEHGNKQVEAQKKSESSHEIASHSKSNDAGISTEEAHAIAKKIAGVKEPIAEEKPREPSSIPKDVSQFPVGKFTLQIGSFLTRGEAERRALELQEKGYKAFVVPAVVKGKNYFRVSVGMFATEKEAKEYRTDFTSKSKIEGTIVQKISL